MELLRIAWTFLWLSFLCIGGGLGIVPEIERQAVTAHQWITSREFVDDEGMVNEAEVEHAAAKDLMDQLDGMEPSDPYFDAKVKVLSEMIDHHVEEEETEYFPACRRSAMDLKAVGDRMEARKAELQAKGGH